MQVLLNSGTAIKDHRATTAYLEGAVREALDHYGERIVRVDAHLSDADSAARDATEDIHCTLEASMAGMEPVVVKERAATTRQAVHGAIGKLERAIAHTLGKQDSRRAQPGKIGPSLV